MASAISIVIFAIASNYCFLSLFLSPSRTVFCLDRIAVFLALPTPSSHPCSPLPRVLSRLSHICAERHVVVQVATHHRLEPPRRRSRPSSKTPSGCRRPKLESANASVSRPKARQAANYSRVHRFALDNNALAFTLLCSRLVSAAGQGRRHSPVRRFRWRHLHAGVTLALLGAKYMLPQIIFLLAPSVRGLLSGGNLCGA